MLLKEISVNCQISEDLDFCLHQSSKMFHWLFFLYFVIYVSLSHLLHSHCFVSSRTRLFFGWGMKAGCMIRPVDGYKGDLARRFKSRKTVTEVLKIPLKVQGFGFSQCWPTKKIIFFLSFSNHIYSDYYWPFPCTHPA